MPLPISCRNFINFFLFTLFIWELCLSDCTLGEESSNNKNDGDKILGSTYFRDAEFKKSDIRSLPMSKEERTHLRDEAREMFYHGYNSYMDKAYPADELMPLSCKGRWRHLEQSRGDIDDVLGNFSLTLVDSLDMLVVLGDLEEFEQALKLIIKDVSFDTDVVVSVFETNIRMVGGLLSGHILAEHLNQLYGSVGWYRGELLNMAHDLAKRLLPAFNTTTGIPHPRVNLKYGMKSSKLHHLKDTCTACAGTIILEFASLSRLSGDPIFEEKARVAMDYLWSQRHRGSDLVGTVLNIHSGDWIRRDSGVGAGIDSYYEYLFKAYILLGDEGYLDRFNKHYNAVMKYVSQGPMLLDVHMHRPHTTSRNFMDALLAFWPGLQVLKGDIKPAIETHEMLYQVIQRHNFLPEAFTTDFQVHWGQHPLRPEFVESTYLLFEATGDPYYLRVGEKVLKSLQKYAWVPCGYAAVNDVRTGVHEDRMDSFVLAETFKYLYLLFTERSDLIINLDEFIFTTEAHLLPLSLARLSNLTTVPVPEDTVVIEDPDVEYSRSCPNTLYLFSGRGQYAEKIRKPLKNYVSNICPNRRMFKRKLRATEFQAGSASHLSMLSNMGISIRTLKDGRVQLLHTASNAKTNEDAEEGLVFMQEMIELSQLQQDHPENPARAVSFMRQSKPKGSARDVVESKDSTLNESGEAKHKDDTETLVVIVAGPAQFGAQLDGSIIVHGPVIFSNPIEACGNIENSADVRDKIVIMNRGGCMFVEKARRIERLGAIGGIVMDNSKKTTASNAAMFAMSGDGTDDVKIPLVFLFSEDSKILLDSLDEDRNLMITLSDYKDAIPSESEKFIQVGGMGTQYKSQATGPMVKSALKKQSAIEVTCDNVIEETVDTEDSPLKKIIDVITIIGGDMSLSSALKLMEKSSSAEELLAASLNFVNTQLFSKRKGIDHHLQSSSILSDLQLLILKKTANNPALLRSLLTKHLSELSTIFKKATDSDNAMENSLQLLLAKLTAFSSGQKSPDHLEITKNDDLTKTEDTDPIDYEELELKIKSDPGASESLLRDALLRSMRRFNSLLKQSADFKASNLPKQDEMLSKIAQIKESFTNIGFFPKSEELLSDHLENKKTETKTNPSMVEIKLNSKGNMFNQLNAFSDEEKSSRSFKREFKTEVRSNPTLDDSSKKEVNDFKSDKNAAEDESESLKSKSFKILNNEEDFHNEL